LRTIVSTSELTPRGTRMARSRASRAGLSTAVTFAIAIALAGGPQEAAADEQPPAAPVTAPPRQPRVFDISEFRVEGADQLSTIEVEKAVMPFLGPSRTLEDVEGARAALEKAYSDRGFQTVAVSIPPQTVRGGVVVLKVAEGKVGRLRVVGARYFSPMDVRKGAPSVAEGTVPNFNLVVQDIVALNQMPDRRVTPAIRPGVTPGTVDVDLEVQDTLPLHGSLEFNNRSSVGTTWPRINGSLRYDNLWQAGHSLSFAFQIAPVRVEDGLVFSLSYLARIPGAPWLTLSAYGVLQDSDVASLGGAAVQGKGGTVGVRGTFTLPGTATFYQSLSTGIDFKRYLQDLVVGTSVTNTPITYWPVTFQYGATWMEEGSGTQLSGTMVLDTRMWSSSPNDFDAKRYLASGNFVYWRGDVSRTQGLPLGMQVVGRLFGQYSPDPLISPEQFVLGGVESVRGYYEAQVAGDYGVAGGLELRSPPLPTWTGGNPTANDWRVFAFVEGGWCGIHDPLPEQQSQFTLWSVGGGTRIRFLEKMGGMVAVSLPLTTAGTTAGNQPTVQFGIWGGF
jgi:hemolysin activation/secretion protein